MSTTSVTTDPEESIIVGNLCFLLGKAFASPSSFEPEHSHLLAELAPTLPEPLAKLALDTATAWTHALEDRDAVLLAYTRLFLGPFEIKAFPYASFYLEPDQKIMGEVSRQIAEAYVEAGLAPGDGPREAPDHIALELEYIYFLSYRYFETGDPSHADDLEAFRTEHLASWVPQFCAAITIADEHTFYSSLARTLAAFAAMAPRQSSTTSFLNHSSLLPPP